MTYACTHVKNNVWVERFLLFWAKNAREAVTIHTHLTILIIIIIIIIYYQALLI